MLFNIGISRIVKTTNTSIFVKLIFCKIRGYKSLFVLHYIVRGKNDGNKKNVIAKVYSIDCLTALLPYIV